jgi:hypothetical protein
MKLPIYMQNSGSLPPPRQSISSRTLTNRLPPAEQKIAILHVTIKAGSAGRSR